MLTLGSIGVPAYDAGRRVWVVDIGGLAEPLAARTAPVPGRPAGHRKQVDDAWYDAPDSAIATTNGPKDAAAQRALSCGPIPACSARRRKDDSGPLLLEHLAQRRQHDVAHPDRPGRRRAEVVQAAGLTGDQAASTPSAARIACVTAAAGSAASTVTRMPRAS